MRKGSVQLKIKRFISSVLIVLILMSTLPIGTFAGELDSEQNGAETVNSISAEDSENSKMSSSDVQDEANAQSTNEESSNSKSVSSVASQSTDSETTQSTSKEGFKIALRWGGTSNQNYTWNAEKKEDRVIKLTFYYQNESANKQYMPGDIQITIPGIGNLNRDSTKKASDIAADEYGVAELTRDWSYKYDEKTDTYTFYNNKEIEKGSTFNGSFEMLWEFSSRDCINDYTKKVKATLNDGENTVTSPELTLNYTSKRDTFYIEKTAKSLTSADGLKRFVEDGKEVSNYAWVQYTFEYNVDQLNARGLKNRYFIDTFPKGAVIAKDSNVIKNENGTVSYKIEETEVLENSGREYSIIVGYPEEYIGKTVKNVVDLYGTYKDEEEAVHLASSEIDVKLQEIQTGTVHVIVPGKYMSPEFIYKDSLDKDINFSATLTKTTSVASTNEEEYTIAITDDLLEIYTDKYYRLKDDEYEFTSVTVPGKNNVYNANGYTLSDGDYNVTIKVLYKDNVNTRALNEYTTIYEGKWENSNISKSIKNAVAVRVEISGLTESLRNFSVYVQGKINISKYESPSYIVNYDFTEFLDKNGNSLVASITEANYTRQDLYEEDKQIYGKGQLRSSDSISIIEKQIEPGYYYAYARMKQFEVDEEIENFVTKQEHGTNVYNTDEREIKKIVMHGINTKEELETQIETLKITYSGLEFKYILSDDVNLEDYLKERASIEKNGKEITVVFDFSDNPIISKEFSIGYSIESKLDYEKYYNETDPKYSIETYVILEDSGLTAKGASSYNGELMADNNDSENILLALASHQQLIKSVKTEYTNNEYVKEGAVAPLNTEYTYRLKLRNGYNTLVNTEIIDILEHSELTDVDGEYPYTESEWHGKLNNVDTTYIESKGLTVKVYYANILTPDENSWTLMEKYSSGIWKTENEVLAIKVKIEGEILENSIIYVDVNMQAPNDESLEDKYTYNTYLVDAEAIDVYTGFKATYLEKVPSNITEVRLTQKEYNVEISKTDAETGNKISGVQFGIYDEEGNKIRTNLTGILGDTTVKSLKEGKYTIKEEIVPLGYEKQEDYTLIIENGSFTLKQGEEIKSQGEASIEGTIPKIRITIENKRAKGSITVYKIDEYLDEAKQEIPLQGIEFDLLDTEGTILGTETTDANGIIVFENIEWGKTYVIQEKEALQGYNQAIENTYLSKLNKDKIVTVENIRKEGSVTLTKEDEIDGTKLEGAKYGLYAENIIYNRDGEVLYEKDTLIKEQTTNAEGQVKFGDLIWGDYYLKEIETVYGYDLSEEKYLFTINSETVETITQKTEKEKRSTAKLELVKVDESGSFLQGAEFGLFDENGNKIVKTNTYLGEEELTFISTGTYGWSQNDDGTWQSENYNVTNSEAAMESNEFTLEYDGTISFDWSVSSWIAAYNYVYYTITNIETGETIGGTSTKIGGTLYGTEYSTLKFNKEEISVRAGVYKISFIYKKTGRKGADLDRAFVKNAKVTYEKIKEIPYLTNENGALSIDEIEWGNYYIQEIKAPQGYEENDTKYSFTIDRETFLNENNMVAYVINEKTKEKTSSISNIKKKGKVSLTKYACNASGEETTNILQGAVYELYLSDGTIIGKYTTNEFGNIIVENLNWGSYYFQELEAPEGYSVSNKKIPFVINSKNVDFMQELVAYDKQETGEIKINKIIKANTLEAGHGNASFMFKIVGKDENDEQKVTLYKAVTFSNSDKDSADENENITKSIIISDIEAYKYEITEEENYRYELSNIIPVENVQVNGEIGTINLLGAENKGEITFENIKTNNSLLTDATIITNTAQSQYYLIGIGARPKEESYAVGTKLTGSDFTFTLYYSGGQEEETDLTEGITFNGESTYTQDITGDYIINIEYALNGKIYETEATTNWIVPNDYFTYEKVKDLEDTIVITGINSKYESPNLLYIPAVYNKKKVESIEYMQNVNNVKVVELAEGINKIGIRAFAEHKSLTNITIPSSVTSIENFAFNKCTNLNKIELPNNITKIGDYAFKECYKLTGEIVIPDSVITIGTDAFAECKMDNVTIKLGKNIEVIGDGAFADCRGLAQDLVIPKSVKTIGKSAFFFCKSLKSLTFEEGSKLETIDNYAFTYCYSLTGDLILPDTLTTLGEHAFKNDYGLNGKVHIPASIVNIPRYVFRTCDSVKEFEIPEGIETIGEYAFYACSGVENILIPSTVNTIGEYAFYMPIKGYDPSYTGIFYLKPNSPEGSSSSWFHDFKKPIIENITFNTSSIQNTDGTEIIKAVQKIGDRAFYGNSNLTSIEVPRTAIEIGKQVFDECSSLTSINVEKENEVYCSVDGILYNKDKTTIIKYPEGKIDVTTYIVPDNITNIGERAFYGCDYFESIEIPNSETTIGEHAFGNCTNLANIILPNGITVIEKGLFYNCTSLTNINIPEGVISIGDDAFYGCSMLVNISIPEGVTNIGYRTFYGCSMLTNISIPEGITSIGDYAFYGCSMLENVSIPEGVTTIGRYVFVGCNSLENIEIPNSVTTIGNGAFYECKNLTSIKISENITTIGEYTFYRCTNLTEIEISEGITSIGNNAFLECRNLTTINYHGTEEQFLAITVGNNNDYFKNATVNYIQD